MVLILASAAIGMTSIQDMRSYGATTGDVTVNVTSDPTGIAFVSVDNVAYPGPPPPFLWPMNSNHTLVAYPIVSGGTGIQYVFSCWRIQTFLNSSNVLEFTANVSATIIAEYVTQYEVSFATNGLGEDTSGIILTLNDRTLTLSQLNSLPTEIEWYNSSLPVNYAFSSYANSTTDGKRYKWDSTSGLEHAGLAGIVKASAPVTVTGNYKTQYSLMVDKEGEGDVAVVPAGEESLPTGDLTKRWFDSGENVTVFAREANCGYRFDSWIGTYNATQDPYTFTMNSSTTETARFNAAATGPTTSENPLTERDLLYSLVVVGILFAALGLFVEHRANPRAQPTSVSAPSRLKLEQKAEKPRAQGPRGTCQKCGHGNRGTAKFCTRCGTILQTQGA